VERAREYAEEALRWLVEDKVAARVSVTAEIVRDGVLGLTIDIYRPTGATVKYTYNYAWAAQALAA
jgi:phage gp46-like protein